jgi:hypothetical protein
MLTILQTGNGTIILIEELATNYFTIKKIEMEYLYEEINFVSEKIVNSNVYANLQQFLTKNVCDRIQKYF